MRTIQSIIAAACLFGISATAAHAALPAFPGAEGFGAGATGGRGAEVYHVTTLDDSGPGSFRDAVSKSHRTIMFDVGGYIELKSVVSAEGDLTIAGQTAPGQGIGILNYEVSFSGSDNVIVRYVRFRLGVNNEKMNKKYSIAIKGKDVIFDHCSIEWGRWDCIGMTDAKDVTVQYCIIGEGVNPQRFGALVESDNVTFSHNLWINNQSRNPKAKGTIQYINNVVSNWGITGLAGGHSGADHYLDAIGNYFIKGEKSNNSYAAGFTDTDKVFQQGNVVDLTPDGKLEGRPAEEKEFANKDGGPTFMPKPYLNPPVPVTVVSAEEALKLVIDGAGCSISRDSVDERLIDEVRSYGLKGNRIQDPAEAGGAGTIKGGEAPKDTDKDGILDAWETAHKLDPNDPKDANTVDSSGYTMLEIYVNGLTNQKTDRAGAAGRK